MQVIGLAAVPLLLQKVHSKTVMVAAPGVVLFRPSALLLSTIAGCLFCPVIVLVVPSGLPQLVPFLGTSPLLFPPSSSPLPSHLSPFLFDVNFVFSYICKMEIL